MSQSLRKYQPRSLRIWHWLNVLAILGLLATVLLRKTLFNWRTNAPLIEEKLKAAGTIITSELAKDIAVTIRNPLWDWHVYLGFALGLLLFGRILIAIFVEKKAPSIRAAKGVFELHYALVKSGYIIFYLSALVMVATGLTLFFKAELAISKDMAGTIKEIHELLMWFFVVFVGGHIVGLIVAENSTDPGIVSDMIHGGDPKLK